MSEEEQLKAKLEEWRALYKQINEMESKSRDLRREVFNLEQTIRERATKFKRGDIVIWKGKWRVRITEVPSNDSEWSNYHGVRLKKNGDPWCDCRFIPANQLQSEPKGNQP